MSETDRLALRLTAVGRVQGVGFRYSAYHEARRLGLFGYVRNLPDESVEMVVQGERGDVLRFVDFCRKGPARARVDDVYINDEPLNDRLNEFRIGR